MRKMMVKRATSNSGLTPMKEPPMGFTKPFQLNCKFRTWSSSSGYETSRKKRIIHKLIDVFTLQASIKSFWTIGTGFGVSLLCLCCLLLCSLCNQHDCASPADRTGSSCEGPWPPGHIWFLPQTRVQIHRSPPCRVNKPHQYVLQIMHSIKISNSLHLYGGELKCVVLMYLHVFTPTVKPTVWQC